MASLAELLIGAQQQTNASLKQDNTLLTGLYKGAELALEKERLAQQKAQLEKAKQDNMLAKWGKVGDAFDSYNKMPDGKAKQIFGKNYIPNMINALGLTEQFDPVALEMMVSDPKLAALMKSKVDNGQWTMEQILAATKSPEALAALGPEAAQFASQEQFANVVEGNMGALSESQRFATTEAGKTARNREMAQAQMGRQMQQQQAAPGVVFSEKTAADAAKFESGGGMASAQTKLDTLRGVLKDLQEGRLKTGTPAILGATSAPFVGGDTALAKIAPKIKEAQDKVRSGVNLKGQMDSQFGDKAMNEAFARAFDPNLPTKANEEKLKKMIKELETDLKAKSRQFQQLGLPVTPLPTEEIKKTAPPPPTTVTISGVAVPVDAAKAFFQANPGRVKELDAATRKALGL